MDICTYAGMFATSLAHLGKNALHGPQLILGLEDLPHFTFDRFRDVVHILRLDNSLYDVQEARPQSYEYRTTNW